MNAQSVITAVRSRLGDIREERWTDPTLLLYVSLCQNDICAQTNFYRQTTTIQLIDGQTIYPLPSDCLRITRLEYLGQFFPVETRNMVDRGEATIPCALKDGLVYNEIEIYYGNDLSRNQTLASVLENIYGVVSDQDANGVDTSDYELENIHGVVSDISSDAAGEDPSTLGELTVYYSAVPSITIDIGASLVVPDIWFSAFLHFVTGTALQDDNDANNIQRGEMELGKYARVLADITKKSSKDFTTNIKSKMKTSIRRV